MAIRKTVSFLLIGAASARLLEWTPAVDGVNDLDTVEKALQKVSDFSSMDATRKAAAKSVVGNVEHVLANMKTSKLTKSEKQAALKGAIVQLKSLKSQWELSAVEGSLKKLVEGGHMSPEMLAKAKMVASSVDGIVDQIEAGKLVGDAQRQEVAGAIQQLTGLEHDLSNAPAMGKVTQMERQLVEKKAMLANEEKELQVFKLQKDLLEKKEALSKLVAEQKVMEGEKKAEEQDQQEKKQAMQDASEMEEATKLVTAAKALAAVKVQPKVAPTVEVKKPVFEKVLVSKAASSAPAHATKGGISELHSRAAELAYQLVKLDAQEKAEQAGLHKQMDTASGVANHGIIQSMMNRDRRTYLTARMRTVLEQKDVDDSIAKIEGRATKGASLLEAVEVPPQMQGILSDLGARVQKLEASLKLLDAQEVKAQANLKKPMSHPRRGSARAVMHEQEVQTALSRRERRMYLKARLMKAVELKELNDGIDKIKKGDVAGLSLLLSKMQSEAKEMQAQQAAKSKNFLH